jgi:NADH dehydrogenase
MKVKTICVLGGTGFVGRHLVTHLANGGRRLRVLTRHRERHKALMVIPSVDLRETDIRKPQNLHRLIADCDAVINLVGILNGSAADFHALHVELPRQIVATCRTVGVKRLLHMSALNADAAHGPSVYLRSKGQGELAVLEASELQSTCFCPSVIFGPNDHFFNRFATLLRLTPVLPLACPYTRFAPVYVDDVVRACEVALEDENTFGKRFELCGPQTYTLRTLVEYTAHVLGYKRLIIGLSDPLAKLQARILTHVPGQPFTLDNYRSLQTDSVCHSAGLAALGITPYSIEALVPGYLTGRRQRDRYRNFRRIARRD